MAVHRGMLLDYQSVVSRDGCPPWYVAGLPVPCQQGWLSTVVCCWTTSPYSAGMAVHRGMLLDYQSLVSRDGCPPWYVAGPPVRCQQGWLSTMVCCWSTNPLSAGMAVHRGMLLDYQSVVSRDGCPPWYVAGLSVPCQQGWLSTVVCCWTTNPLSAGMAVHRGMLLDYQSLVSRDGCPPWYVAGLPVPCPQGWLSTVVCCWTTSPLSAGMALHRGMLLDHQSVVSRDGSPPWYVAGLPVRCQQGWLSRGARWTKVVFSLGPRCSTVFK